MAEARSARMEPIATLPVFFKLGGRRAVLAGGGEPAVWKAALLSAAGARVEVFAPDPHPDLVAMTSQPPGGTITIHRRLWTPSDLPGAAIALGAIEDDEEAARFQAAAKAAGVPVNVIDKPAFCDFQFGTIVSRSPLIIGISTDGAAPVFGQAIRARIEALLPQNLRGWAEAARDWRPSVQARALGFRARRRFWEVFAERALANPGAAPGEADREACMAAAEATIAYPATATLTLVGAGNGSADAITLAAIKALQDADVVIHADDINPVVIGYARREAATMSVGANSPPAEAALQVSSMLHAGRRHVWLDRGDPWVCLRWTERHSTLNAAGLEARRVSGLGPCGNCQPGCAAYERPAQ